MPPIGEPDGSDEPVRGGSTLPEAMSLLAIAALLLLAPGAATTHTRTFAAGADAFVASARPTTNFGAHRRLIVHAPGASSATRRSYVRFSISLPAGAKVTGARLYLYATTGRATATSVLRASNSWRERGVTWRNRPAVTSVVLARDARAGRGWRELPVGVVAPGRRTFLLRGHGTAPRHYLAREGAKKPRLVVTYTHPRRSAACPVARPQATWRSPGSRPLTDRQAATCVVRSGESHSRNMRRNAKAPTAAELDAFRSAQDSHGRTPARYNRNFTYVTGAAARYGLRSTDDMIEWAAYKWGVPENLVRAQMFVESGWSMGQRGDRRDWATPVGDRYPARAVIDADSVWESLGIAQIRWRHTVPWNPGVEPLRWQSTGFAVDYSQALVRYYYDGLCGWCGEGYAAGDADGAYRAYFSGSWTRGQRYADRVRATAAAEPWLPLPPP